MSTEVSTSLSRLVAANVRRIRLQRGWTQAELGKILGLPQSRVSEIESGVRAITSRTIDILCSKLDIVPAELLYQE